MSHRIRSFLTVVLLACGSGGCVWVGAAGFGTPQLVAEVTDARVREASGLVASRRHSSHYYTHNDSPTPHELYLLDRTGTVRAVVRLRNVGNLDWEDSAWAPATTTADGPAATADVVLADIGDNKARRAGVVLYRFSEPALPAGMGGAVEVTPTAYRLRYPDQPHNAESLFVDPRTGDGYIITKSLTEPARLYRLPAPWTPDVLTTLEYVGQVAPQAAGVRFLTAADISTDGARIVARCPTGGCLWERGPDQSIAEALAGPPQMIHLAAEPQGEAIAFSPAGDALLTISEKSPTALYEVRAE